MRDAALIAALSQLVDAHPGWGVLDVLHLAAQAPYTLESQTALPSLQSDETPCQKTLAEARSHRIVGARPSQSRLVGRFHE